MDDRGGSTPSFFIGKIKSGLPNLTVQTGDIVLDKNNLMIDKWIHDRSKDLFSEKQGHTHGGDTTGDGAHTHEIREPIKDVLKAGDSVVMLRSGDTFIIISKVVSL